MATQDLRKGRRPSKPLEFLIGEVLTYDGDECRYWPFGLGGGGYGKIRIDGRHQVVSRVVCAQVHGPAPTSRHQAAHSCGNGHLGCVTKRHLSWKTRSENEADKLAHGTKARGAAHGLSKLTEAQVHQIRALRGRMGASKIAEQFGTSRTNVGNILSGKTWVWLKTPD